MGRDTIIFGAGAYGKFINAYLAKEDSVTVKGFCDNNSQIQGAVIGKLKVFSLEDSLKLFPNAFYLIANKVHGEEIREQLIQNGVKEEYIYIYIYIISK